MRDFNLLMDLPNSVTEIDFKIVVPTPISPAQIFVYYRSHKWMVLQLMTKINESFSSGSRPYLLKEIHLEKKRIQDFC